MGGPPGLGGGSKDKAKMRGRHGLTIYTHSHSSDRLRNKCVPSCYSLSQEMGATGVLTAPAAWPTWLEAHKMLRPALKKQWWPWVQAGAECEVLRPQQATACPGKRDSGTAWQEAVQVAPCPD